MAAERNQSKMTNKKRVLFLCVGNSCRSQMAEGFLRAIASDKYDVYSAGVVSSGLSTNAVKVMSELGIDISVQKSKRVEEFTGQRFDYVITVCDSSENNPCPVFLGQSGKQFHWPFYDPAYATGDKEDVFETFRRVRDQITERIECFVKEEAIIVSPGPE